MLDDKLDYISHRLRDWNALDCGFAAQLLRNSALLLQVGDNHVHQRCVREAYVERLAGTGAKSE